jgi:hypothetical protein
LTEQDLFAQLEDVFADVLAEETSSVASLTTKELQHELYELTEEIKRRLETMHPRTQEGRDIHSRRNAIQIELRRRNA